MGMPAARTLDLTAHVATPLAPGPGSMNVLIGGKPAWRGISPVAAVALAAAIADIAKAMADATKAASTNNLVLAADAADRLEDSTVNALQIMGSTDQHACPVPLPVPHGMGVVIGGSTTVLINGLPACGQGDAIQEITAVNSIAMGCSTVLIGG